MCELLKDNIEAERKRAVSDNRVSGDLLFKAPQLREIPDMLSWLQCFHVDHDQQTCTLKKRRSYWCTRLW